MTTFQVSRYLKRNWRRQVVSRREPLERKEPTTPIPALAELQKQILSAVTFPEGVRKAVQLKNHVGLLDSIVDQPLLSREERLAIYGDGYFSRLIGSLKEDFGILVRILGEDEFENLCHRYLAAYPSHTTGIDEVGEHLSKFLLTDPLSETMPFLSDAASISWLGILAFFADDSATVDQTSLTKVPEEAWATATFKLAPSVGLWRSDWAVQNALKDISAEGPKLVEAFDSGPHHVVVFRRNEVVYFKDISPLSFQILQLIQEGHNLGELTLKIGGQTEEELSAIQTCFTESFGPWIAEGIIAQITF
jgi:hypothetical protein